MGERAMSSEPNRADVMRWRKSERERLIAARLAVPAEQRQLWSARIIAELQAIIGSVKNLVVSAYWPFRGEPDLRPFMSWLTSQGGVSALPIVVEKATPLRFRSWAEGEPLERGVWNIPIPAGGTPVVPDVAIAPVVGYDRHCYRLGYGGGFFDRTLASLNPQPRVIGVGYELQFIDSIQPLAHDIPMSAIVTEAGVHLPRAS